VNNLFRSSVRSIFPLLLPVVFLDSACANEWFYLGGNRAQADSKTELQAIYTEINPGSIRQVVIDGNKGVFFRIRVGAIFQDGRSGIAEHDDDEMIRDCVRNSTWHVRTKRWQSDWKEIGDYLCDLSIRPNGKWGEERFRIKTE